MKIKSVLRKDITNSKKSLQPGDILKYKHNSTIGAVMVSQTDYGKFTIICLKNGNRYFDNFDSLECLQIYLATHPNFVYKDITKIAELYIENFEEDDFNENRK